MECHAQAKILVDDPGCVQQGIHVGGMKLSGSNDNKLCCLVEYIDAFSTIKQRKLKFRKDMKPSMCEHLMKVFRLDYR